MTDRSYLTAAEAAGLLGVSRSSLYAYVSRGRIRATRARADSRQSRYLAADILRLRDRKEARRSPEASARKTLAWGLPVLESSITLIDDGQLYYRGRAVASLAKSATFEDVVRLLWDAEENPAALRTIDSGELRRLLGALPTLAPIERMQSVLPLAAAADHDADRCGSPPDFRTAWRILHILTVAATGRAASRHRTIAATLADGWNVAGDATQRLIDLALLLCADHELNISTFAVRVVASARSSLYDAVGAGLGALRGALHGGFTDRVEHLFDESRGPEGLRAAMNARLRRGEDVPGFGHPLYPRGDPRAVLLSRAITAHGGRYHAPAFVRAGTRAGRALLDDLPTIDFSLVALRRALGLPRGSALVLFALGRTAGWIAHAMEQYASGRPIRPRAAYVGPRP